MKRLQAFKYELQPNGQQAGLMNRFAGSCRFVFNKALALQKEHYERGEKRLSYAGLCKILTEWKEQSEISWLCETPSQALQQSLKDLERAYQARLNAAPERRRNPLPSWRGGCQKWVQSVRDRRQAEH